MQKNIYFIQDKPNKSLKFIQYDYDQNMFDFMKISMRDIYRSNFALFFIN